jgi:hypothetical protein
MTPKEQAELMCRHKFQGGEIIIGEIKNWGYSIFKIKGFWLAHWGMNYDLINLRIGEQHRRECSQVDHCELATEEEKARYL